LEKIIKKQDIKKQVFTTTTMKQKIIIFSVFTLMIFTGCKTTRSIAKKGATEESQIAQLIQKVQKAQPNFNTANVSKMAMEFDLNERKVNVLATCKIRKDSAIFLSIQPFMGIELYKAEIMPDSIRVFDKMNRKYYVMDYTSMSKRFGVDINFTSLQALIFNQFFCIGVKELLPDSCKLTPLADGRNKIDFETEKMQQSTEISSSNTIQQVLLKSKDVIYQLQTNYDDFTAVNNVNFPQKITLLATSKKSKASCVFSILKLDFNTDFKLTATATDRYTRGEIDQLLKK